MEVNGTGNTFYYLRKQARKRRRKTIISVLIKSESLNILLSEKKPDNRPHREVAPGGAPRSGRDQNWGPETIRV